MSEKVRLCEDAKPKRSLASCMLYRDQRSRQGRLGISEGHHNPTRSSQHCSSIPLIVKHHLADGALYLSSVIDEDSHHARILLILHQFEWDNYGYMKTLGGVEVVRACLTFADGSSEGFFIIVDSDCSITDPWTRIVEVKYNKGMNELFFLKQVNAEDEECNYALQSGSDKIYQLGRGMKPQHMWKRLLRTPWKIVHIAGGSLVVVASIPFACIWLPVQLCISSRRTQ
ncbi:hypothetical protein BKA62DRAFT_834126 [Auriculariales sp. MPI-PUGE-AT-0066]|nr:hypothetical protein BKA62DRAFT_834126 [Auriculariales sp. MPI-PUGE-AT-0066]